MPESEEVLKKQRETNKQKKWGMSKGNKKQPEKTTNRQTWNNVGNKIKKVVLDVWPIV